MRLDEAIRPFKITVDETMLSDLSARLNNARYFNAIVEGKSIYQI